MCADSALQDHHRGVRSAADRVGQSDAGPRDLPLAGTTLQLAHELHDLSERGRTEGFALGQQTAARVYGEPATEGRGALVEKCRRPARFAQPQLLVTEQLARRVGVLALDDV